jgi:hypothetical protein
MMGTKHHAYIFEGELGTQLAVEIWDDGVVDVKVRPDSGSIWGLPLRQVMEEGDPVYFNFEEEDDEEV